MTKLLWSFILSISLLSSGLAQAAAPMCSGVFVDEAVAVPSFNLELMTRVALAGESAKFESWSQRAVILVMKRSIKTKVMERCRAAGCTESDVARLVESSIVESFQKFDDMKAHMMKIRGYAVLTGLSVGVAVTSHYVKGALPAADQWMSEFVTIGTSIGLYKLGAPLWDYLSGVVSRGAFRMQDGKTFFRDAAEMAHYEERYRILQEKMTPREQQQAARVAGLLNSTESTFSSAIESIMSKDPSKGGIERASARIANAAIKARKFFPEISFDDPDMSRTVNMLFTQFLPHDGTREKLYEMVIVEIAKNDPAYRDARTADIYKRTIRIWAGLDEVN